MGRSSVEATKVFRICAVRAIRSAWVARLPLLAGLWRFDLRLDDTFVTPDFVFAALALLVLAVDDFALPDVDDFLLLVVECLVAAFESPLDWEASGSASNRHTSPAAA